MGGGGLSFLSKKWWHPSRPDNMEKVWIEEQKAEAMKKRLEQIAKERDNEEAQNNFYRSLGHGNHSDINKSKVSFLYQPPPGFKEIQAKESKIKKEEEFNELLKTENIKQNPDDPLTRAKNRELEFLNDKNLSNAEKDSKRFHFLKGAPTMGDYVQSADIKLRHNPLGVRVNYVRCIRCGEWGHGTGDKECKLKDNNPNDSSRIRVEDPLTTMQNSKLARKRNRDNKNSSAYVRFGDMNTNEDPDDDAPKFVLKHQPGERSPIVGGGSKNDPEHQFLSGDESQNSDEADMEYLRSLSQKDKNLLIKMLKKESKRKKLKRSKKHKDKKRKKKRKRKHKKRSPSKSESSEWVEA